MPTPYQGRGQPRDLLGRVRTGRRSWDYPLSDSRSSVYQSRDQYSDARKMREHYGTRTYRGSAARKPTRSSSR